MDIKYLYNLINLYLRNETDEHKTNMVIKNKDENLEISFNMDITDPDKTTFDFPKDLFLENIEYILDFFKQNLVVIDEKYDYNKVLDVCNYYAELKNGRMISFDDFSISEVNDIRNKLYHIKYHPDEIRVKVTDDIEYQYQNALKMQTAYAGFASYKTLILVGLILLVVLIVSLLIFG